MANEDLIFRIKDEIYVCDSEIRKADDIVIRMQEHRVCYDTRKTMLKILLDIAEEEVDNNDKQRTAD